MKCCQRLWERDRNVLLAFCIPSNSNFSSNVSDDMTNSYIQIAFRGREKSGWIFLMSMHGCTHSFKCDFFFFFFSRHIEMTSGQLKALTLSLLPWCLSLLFSSFFSARWHLIAFNAILILLLLLFGVCTFHFSTQQNSR